MKMRACSSLLGFVASSLLAALFPSSLQAQGVWPPLDAPMNNTFTAGDGHKYSVEFYDVVNTIVDPRGNIIAGPALRSVFLSFDVGPGPMLQTYTDPYTNTLYDPISNPPGTKMDSVGLWRIADASIPRYGVGGYRSLYYSVMGDPVFRYRVIKLDANTAVNVVFRIANGVSHATASTDAPTGAPFNTTVSCGGVLNGRSVTASASPQDIGSGGGLMNTHQQEYKGVRFIDSFQRTTNFQSDNTAYLLLNCFPSAICQFPSAGYVSYVQADSKWEFIPIGITATSP